MSLCQTFTLSYCQTVEDVAGLEEKVGKGLDVNEETAV